MILVGEEVKTLIFSDYPEIFTEFSVNIGLKPNPIISSIYPSGDA